MRFMEFVAYALLTLALGLAIASFWIGIHASGLMYTEPPTYATDRTDEFLALKYHEMEESFFQFALVTGVVGGFLLVGSRMSVRKKRKPEVAGELHPVDDLDKT